MAFGGIGTSTDSDGWEYEPLQPAASTFVISHEAMNLAMEARNRANTGRMTLEELGQMLNDFGWQFPEGKSSGEHLIEFLSAWVNYASNNSDEEDSFTPTFFKEMALQQNPSIFFALIRVLLLIPILESNFYSKLSLLLFQT